ncbi:regucalcin-like [Zerene cesonia]|uniref:regucalcin-like n=1 Tax=Zerene cesonia TaxID=33412 RepID=UPI0018E52B43|nr:regucalcin-like [Zerene cesonia]
MIRINYFLYQLLCIAFAAAASDYNISTIYTSDNPDEPAIFNHGESPEWDADSQSLLFVDVHKQNVHRLDYASGNLSTKHIDYGQVNVVARVSGSSRLLVTVRSAVYLLDWDVSGDSALRLLATVDEGLPSNVINEGKPDPSGRFWAGTKGPQEGDDVKADKATLYSFDINQDGLVEPRVQLRPVTISNGLTWSLNGTVMYYIDSATKKVEAFDFDADIGAISGRRTIFDISELDLGDAIPDGMTIDSDGQLWVALMFGGTVLHIDPDTKQLVYSYTLPVSRITSVCWGGPNLDTLFVTTSQRGANETLAGAIFTITNTGSKGVAPYEFVFNNADSY